jgi:hypothetical protein
MRWLNNVIASLTGNKKDVNAIRDKLQAADQTTIIADEDLLVYIDDVEDRCKKIVKKLKNLYAKYGIAFSGFKSLESACTALRDSLKDGKETAYNNLIKLESSITAEQKRHLSLIKIAMSKEGKKVLDEINAKPQEKAIFVGVFGERNVGKQENIDGAYQRLWSEIHKLSEYILLQKNKVYH